MGKYTFSKKFASLSPSQIWIEIIEKLYQENIQTAVSITNIKYQLLTIDSSKIAYTGENRNQQKEEFISADVFIELLKVMKSKNIFSTNSVKDYVPSKIYIKRSPSFAILLSLKVIILI